MSDMILWTVFFTL